MIFTGAAFKCCWKLESFELSAQNNNVEHALTISTFHPKGNLVYTHTIQRNIVIILSSKWVSLLEI